MTPDKLPQEIADKIKSDATAYSDIPRFIAYTQGATAWARWKVKHDELLAQAQCMADFLNEISEESCDYESTNFAKALHSPECRACNARELLQQFKDGKGKEVGDESA